MAKGVKRPKDFTRDSLARFLASAVEDAIVQRDPTVKRPEVLAAGQLAGRIASEFLFLPIKKQRSLSADRSALDLAVAEFVSSLVGGIEQVEKSNHVTTEDASGLGDPFLKAIEEWAGPVAGPTFLETNYNISRSTLHRWHRRHEVIGFRTGGRKHVFPLSQFVDGRPASGLSKVIALMPHSRIAWAWLKQPNPNTEHKSPLALLKLDRVAEVVNAAEKYAASIRVDRPK